MTFGVDYAWGRPGVKALEGAAVQFVARYLSYDTTGKNLTPDEARQIADAGIWLLVVWESTANRALDGYAAGRSDATEAARQAAADGMPADRPIYFAVDFDAGSGDQAAIDSYLDGAASVLGVDRVGIYGGYYPVKRAMDGGHAKWGWQTYGWSGGQWYPGAQLHQYSNDHIIGGVDLDYDEAPVGDYGQWRPGQSPTPSPQKEEDMPSGLLITGKGAVTPISLPRGRYTAIGFVADNGLAAKPPVQLRVAVHAGGGNWQVSHIVVDSSKDKPWVTFEPKDKADAVSVQYSDDGTVPVAWDVS